MLTGQVIENRFRVDGQAGQGGMGTVYRGTDLQTQRPIAIKVLSVGAGADVERFEREGAVLARLSHPAIVRYIASGVLPGEGDRYLAMDWVDGETLADRLTRTGLDNVESVKMAARLADALGTMHRQGVVHRDLKPKNLILLEGKPELAMIIDFGIARQAWAPADVSLTRTGVMVGTMGYMAPEQARGARAIDGRVDLFALGCILYECLVGHAPFRGPDMPTIRAKILLSDPVPPTLLNPDVSTQFSDLVMRLLEKDREHRPTSAEELAAQVSALHEKPGDRRPRMTQTNDVTRTITPSKPTPVSSRPTCLVVLGNEEEPTAGEELAEARRDRLSRSLPPASRLEVLGDGCSVLVFEGGGAIDDVAGRAAHHALKLREDFPNVPIAISAMSSTEDTMEALIDRGMETLARESMDSIFQDATQHPGGSAIRLDDQTAPLLPARFRVVHSPSGHYLLGEAA